ncbi:MAG: lysophospholipid acyltransferase family protein [Candidatus Babeliales bacterium]
MSKVKFIFHNIVSFVLGFSIGICTGIPMLVIATFPARWRYENRVYYFFLDLFYKGILWATFLPVTVVGKENLLNEPAIIIANHQSSLDIPLLGSILDRHSHVWLFLARFARIPLFGFITRRMNVVVDPTKLRRMVGALDHTLDIVKNHNTHILLFPEAGRYTDGTIHKFFYGFAILAKATNRPVIPVIIYGAGKVLPPRALFISSYPMKIVIGKPVYFTKEHTEQEIVDCMQEWFTRTYVE